MAQHSPPTAEVLATFNSSSPTRSFVPVLFRCSFGWLSSVESVWFIEVSGLLYWLIVIATTAWMHNDHALGFVSTPPPQIFFSSFFVNFPRTHYSPFMYLPLIFSMTGTEFRWYLFFGCE